MHSTGRFHTAAAILPIAALDAHFLTAQNTTGSGRVEDAASFVRR